jgi:hypothetical protein
LQITLEIKFIDHMLYHMTEKIIKQGIVERDKIYIYIYIYIYIVCQVWK